MLAGCAGKVFQETLPAYYGKPIDAVIAKLGVPDSESVVAGRKVFVWRASTFEEGTQYQCTLRVITQAEVVSAFDYSGNNLMCMRYSRRLEN